MSPLVNAQEAMAVLRAAYDGENLTEAQLQKLLMNSMAQVCIGSTACR